MHTRPAARSLLSHSTPGPHLLRGLVAVLVLTLLWDISGLDLPVLQKIEEIDFSGVDLCFCALPHATSQAVISQLPRNLKIVDLSADFRLRDPAEYEKWYGNPHAAVDLQAEAVYGLTEFYRAEIAKGRLVAGTGCNAATLVAASTRARTRSCASTRSARSSAVCALAVAERSESTLAPRILSDPRITALVSVMTMHCGWPITEAVSIDACSMASTPLSVSCAEGSKKLLMGSFPISL